MMSAYAAWDVPPMPQTGISGQSPFWRGRADDALLRPLPADLLERVAACRTVAMNTLSKLRAAGLDDIADAYLPSLAILDGLMEDLCDRKEMP